MEKLFEYTKSIIVNYKLDLCCWIAPVRIGLMIIGYFNIFVAFISLIGTANESFTPTIMKVQETLMEDNVSKPVPILAYSTELGFSVLLLCAIYRKDIALMRIYMRYCLAAIIMSVLVYSMVIAIIDVLVLTVIILGIAYQIYVLFLVRSAIVEMKAEKKQYELPTLIHYNPSQTPAISSAGNTEDQDKETQDKTEDIKDIKIEINGKPDNLQGDGKADDVGKKDEKIEEVGKKDVKIYETGKNGKSDDMGKKDGKVEDMGKKDGKSETVESVPEGSKKSKFSIKDMKKKSKEAKLKTVEESAKE